MRLCQPLIDYPWILEGDFNQVRWVNDRSGDLRGLSLICEFNDVITDFEVLEIPLKNRKYTWSSKRSEPTFSKLDRVFLSADWNLKFPTITLQALEMTVSDHAPLLLECKNLQTQRRQPRLETFWLKYKQASDIVSQIRFQNQCDSGNAIRVSKIKWTRCTPNWRISTYSPSQIWVHNWIYTKGLFSSSTLLRK